LAQPFRSAARSIPTTLGDLGVRRAGRSCDCHVSRLGCVTGLIREAAVFAELRGLRLAAIGAGEQLLPLWRQAGLRSLYIGDEALIDTRVFSLDGRSVRKLRQSVNRLERQGYRVEVRNLKGLDGETLAELEHVSSLWRARKAGTRFLDGDGFGRQCAEGQLRRYARPGT
jgi:phosphatidylglycerol lysyltransferase-like protein